MAKKDEEFRYGESSIPTGEKKYSIIRWNWNGLNRTDDIDTGQLSDMSGVMVDPPYLYPYKKPKKWIDFKNGIPAYENSSDGHMVVPPPPVFKVTNTKIRRLKVDAIYGFDTQLCMAWEMLYPAVDGRETMTDMFHYTGNNTQFSSYECLSTFNTPPDVIHDGHRTVLQFNVVDTSSGNVAAYSYDKKMLLYPDCVSFPYDFTEEFEEADRFNTSENPIPQINFASVFQSRVFGSSDNAVTASAFNSYVDYTLDDATSVASDHAWWSMAGSNTEANGDFTAVVAHDNHVVLFRKDFMQLVYNNKNPFRIVDVGAFGCDNPCAWTILNGVLYFASWDKVYAFTGGTPKDISKKLEAGDLRGAVLGSYRDTVWMQTKDTIYIYKNGVWSDLGNIAGEEYRVKQFATLDYGLVGLLETNTTYRWDDEDYVVPTYSLWFFDWDVGAMDVVPDPASDWEPDYDDSEWWFETDLMALGRLDIRRVKKFSMLCQGSEDAEVAVWLLKDGEPFDEDTSVKIGEMTFDDDGYHLMRILTRQFSSTMHKLRFAGKGFVKIYAAELKISWGGDVYVEK